MNVRALDLSYTSSESNFTFSGFHLSYYSNVLYFICWVSNISLEFLKRLVNAVKDYFLYCLMLTTFLIALNIDAIGYRLS